MVEAELIIYKIYISSLVYDIASTHTWYFTLQNQQLTEEWTKYFILRLATKHTKLSNRPLLRWYVTLLNSLGHDILYVYSIVM